MTDPEHELRRLADYLGQHDHLYGEEPVVDAAIRLIGHSALLSDEELVAMQLTALLAESLSRIIVDKGARESDLYELIIHVHAIQRAILAQGTARSYPDRYRLLGYACNESPDEPPGSAP